jgi:competence protein ComEC
MQRPFLFFLTAIIFGIITGHYLSPSASGLLICLFPLVVFLLLGLFFDKPLLILLSVIAILFLQGCLNILLFNRPFSLPMEPLRMEDHKTIFLEGVISDSPQNSPENTQFVLQATRVFNDGTYSPMKVRVLLTLKGRHLVKYGDFIRCETRLKKPRNFNNPGGFDYERRLRFENISYLGFINDKSRLIVLREGQGNAFRNKIEEFRSRIRQLINRNAPFPEQTILQAMILGNSKEIPQPVLEKFNMTGTSHILAVSGFNVGLVALWTIVVLRWLFKRYVYLMLRFNVIKLSLVSAFLPVILYTFVAGAGMSVLRATIMALIFMIAILLDRSQDMVNTMAAAAALILMISPDALFDISFQLSFAAVAAILLINPLIGGNHQDDDIFTKSSSGTVLFNKIKGNAVLFLITTISATLGTLPILAFYFNRISLIVLPANVVLVPILGLMALPLSMMVIAISPLSEVLAGILIHCSAWLVKISLYLVDFFAGLPGAAFYVCTPSLWQIAAFYILLICLVCLVCAYRQKNSPESRGKIRRLWVIVVLVLLIFTAGYIRQYYQQSINKELRVTAIDVHQGNAALIRIPGGNTMLGDGGGTYGEAFDVGRSVVAPFLWHEGIRKIDVVVLSHAHTDHLGGLPFILENFHVREVWSNGEAADTELYRRFLEIIQRKGIKHRIIRDHKKEMQIGRIGIQLFNAEDPDYSEKNLNEKSLMMRMTFGRVSLLLPGDIGVDNESYLLENGFDLRSQVLFVPHHGSRKSSGMPFLNAVKPQIALISCGLDNLFGFPHQEILERYEAAGTKIFRTDLQGAITISTGGQNIRTEFYKK